MLMCYKKGRIPEQGNTRTDSRGGKYRLQFNLIPWKVGRMKPAAVIGRIRSCCSGGGWTAGCVACGSRAIPHYPGHYFQRLGEWFHPSPSPSLKIRPYDRVNAWYPETFSIPQGLPKHR